MAFSQEINNFADRVTPFVCDEILERVLNKLEENSELDLLV